jgi:HSP20 family molecular chaperone IbpA
MICVEGKHEEKAEDGSRMVSRQFLRRYRLPQGTKPEDVTSNLSSDGVLVVTAEKNPAIENKTDQK